MMDPAAWQAWFEELWALREERLYPQFFDLPPARAQPLAAATFARLGVETPDPRFLTHLVLEFAPSPNRPHVLYATSGMSNPWGEDPATLDPKNFSGLGFEFTMHVPQPAGWAVELLNWLMAVQLLVATGQLQGQLLEPLDLIPLGGPLGSGQGALTHVLVVPPPSPEESPFGYPPRFGLPSGQVDLLLLLGITGREADFLKSQGPEPLLALLRHREVFPLTDVSRASLV
ncbi:MAG TPA: suppressor of fused domain protein [Phycisphaerae bacterium]|nr:suppressor of fused domain protein [Phycisphaerae bacterium]